MSLSKDPDAVPTQVGISATSTKWWITKDPSPTPTRIPDLQHATAAPTTEGVLEKCPVYALEFKPGTYGYIALFPPYNNLIRSGPGKNHSSIGYIEVGSWVKILDSPVCDDAGYIWLNVQSAGSSSAWTAGGRHNSQWVIPCSDPKQKCAKSQAWLSTSPPDPDRNGNEADRCVSGRLTVGLDAQVNPADLLIVRAEPYSGSILGHISPAAVVTIVGGPKCRGGAVWWKVASEQLAGWAVENLLKPCPKEEGCKAWK